MKIPRKIARKIKKQAKARDKSDKLYEEIDDWFSKNDGDDIYRNSYNIVKEPAGDNQGNGEFCDQSCGYSGDDYYGTYYFPIKGSRKYVAMGYEC